jgi:hypothetical protein
MNAQETLRAARERGLTLKAAGDKLRIAPAQAVDDVLRAALVAHKLAILRMLTNPRAEHPSSPEEEIQPLSTKQEAARREVLAQLAANPTVQRALCNRFENGALIITLAIRGIGTGELLIPAERFNPGRLEDYAALLACLDAQDTRPS